MFNSAICLLTSFTMSIMGASDYDEYGGWTAIKGEKTGYFHAERIDRVWWLIDPAGNGFLSKGVNHISYTADKAPTTFPSLLNTIDPEDPGQAKLLIRRYCPSTPDTLPWKLRKC